MCLNLGVELLYNIVRIYVCVCEREGGEDKRKKSIRMQKNWA